MNIQDHLDEFKEKFGDYISGDMQLWSSDGSLPKSLKTKQAIKEFIKSALTSYAKQEREKQKELDLTEMSELVNHAYTRSHPTERYREGFEDCQLSLRETLNMKIQYLHDQKDQ